MQEHQVTVGGVRHALERPFFVLATQNPIEQEGTYPLPEAQLDRFMFNVVINYPTASDERQILAADDDGRRAVGAAGRHRRADRARAHAGARDRRPPTTSSTTRCGSCAPRGRRARPTTACPTSCKQWVRWGAGPRAGQALLLGGKARAVLDGRPAVSLDDIRAVAPPVLRHRLLVNFQAEADGIDAETVVTRLLGCRAQRG